MKKEQTDQLRSPQNGGASVLVQVLIAAPLFQRFTYLWPFAKSPKKGLRVIVPWGRQHRVGLIDSISDSESGQSTEFKIKSVLECLDEDTLLSEHWWRLIEFAARYYHHPLGMIALEALPKALRVLNAKGQEPVMVGKVRSSVSKQTLPAKEAGKTDSTLGDKPTLNESQHLAVRSLESLKGFRTALLYGVTGSGKTEVYLHLIESTLARGEQVLVLLPEINLTPAAMALYQNRFANYQVTVLHSELAEMKRTQAWFAAASGKADVVIGTRLGVLTPLPRLGLIVVDEEHDPSYKQQDGMRYQARDLAIMLAKQRDCPIVLGSATPSMESWQKVLSGQMQRIDLKVRAVQGAKLPQVELINTANFPAKNGLAEPVRLAIEETMQAGMQTLVFLNRRGYAPQLVCDACGWVAHCSQCSAHTVWHKSEGMLRCHHCGLSTRVPTHCPECGNQDLSGFGRGTQRIEEVLEELFPKARVMRMDADTTRQKGQAQSLLDMAHAGEVDILVGTQMISKGHDFANVGLVVALNSDASLYSHAYRSPERLFAQLMQVAGRAGRRGGSAKMLVQTRYPDHPLFDALKAHDYELFAQNEILNRQEARMPPFVFQAKLRADHKELAKCLVFLNKAKSVGQQWCAEQQLVTFCDPVPLNVVRVGGLERAQLLVESDNRPALHAFLDEWVNWLLEQKGSVRWYLEVDPLDL